MRKALLILSLFICANAGSVVWDGGATGSWETATNWVGDTLPDANDSAIFNTSVVAVTIGGNVSIASLRIADVCTLTIDGAYSLTASDATPLFIGSNSVFKISATTTIVMSLQGGGGKFPRLGSNAKIISYSNMFVYLFNNSVVDTISYLDNDSAISGTRIFTSTDLTGNRTLYFTDTNNLYNVQLTQQSNTGTSLLTINQYGKLNCKNLSVGTLSSLSSDVTLNLLGDVTMSAFNVTYTMNSPNAVQTVNFLNSTDTCNGSFIALSNHTYNRGNSRWVFTGPSASTITTSSKPDLFNIIEISKNIGVQQDVSGKLEAKHLILKYGKAVFSDSVVVDTLSINTIDTSSFVAPVNVTGDCILNGGVPLFTGILSVGGDLTIDSNNAKFTQGNKIYVSGDLIINSKDTVYFNDSVFIGGNITIRDSALIRYSANAVFVFTGWNEHNVTLNESYLPKTSGVGWTSTEPVTIDVDTTGYKNGDIIYIHNNYLDRNRSLGRTIKIKGSNVWAISQIGYLESKGFIMVDRKWSVLQ